MYFGITEKGEEERTESNGRQIKKERETEGNTNIKENEETEAKARLYICFCSVGMPGGGLTGERCLPGVTGEGRCTPATGLCSLSESTRKTIGIIPCIFITFSCSYFYLELYN